MEWKLLNSSLFQVHSSMKPFLCNLCDSKFARISHLNRHTRTHTGERPFDCDRCGKTFARQDKLKVCLRQIFCILANTIVSGGHRRRTKALLFPRLQGISTGAASPYILYIYSMYMYNCTLYTTVHCTLYNVYMEYNIDQMKLLYWISWIYCVSYF